MDYFSRLFGCCIANRRNEEIYTQTNYEKNDIITSEERKSLLKYKRKNKFPEEIPIPIINNSDDELLIDEKFIREDEKGKITFTKNGIVKFVNEISNDEQYNWILLYNKNDLIIHYQNGSILCDNILLGKTYYKMPKSLIKQKIDYKLMAKVVIYNVKKMYDPVIRNKYDNTLKEFKIYEEGEYYNIYKNWIYSPVFFISERDMVNKRIEFIKDDIYYNLATSVDDEYDPPSKNVVRCKTYLNLVVLKQDEENYYFHCLSQYDAKTFIPEKILNITIPFKTQEWYNNYVTQLNAFLEEESKEETN